MRVTNMVPDTLYNIQQSQQALSTALQQVSTGLRVNQPSDDPAASANMVLSLASSANVDQYTKNISAVTSQMQTADSALSSVVTSLNTAVTLGTSGASGILSAANKQAIATQVQGVLANVVSQANASYQGAYLFGGSETTGPPVLPASTTYTSRTGTISPSARRHFAADRRFGHHHQRCGHRQDVCLYRSCGPDHLQPFHCCCQCSGRGYALRRHDRKHQCHRPTADQPNSNSAGIVASSNDPVLGAMTATPGTEVPNAYAYVGNNTVNSVPVGDSLNVATNLPGGQIFTSGANVIGVTQRAHHRPSKRDFDTNRNRNQRCLHGTGRLLAQQRVPLDNSISQLNSQESYLGQETLSLTTQQTVAGRSQPCPVSYQPLPGGAHQQRGPRRRRQSIAPNPAQLPPTCIIRAVPWSAGEQRR